MSSPERLSATFVCGIRFACAVGLEQHTTRSTDAPPGHPRWPWHGLPRRPAAPARLHFSSVALADAAARDTMAGSMPTRRARNSANVLGELKNQSNMPPAKPMPSPPIMMGMFLMNRSCKRRRKAGGGTTGPAWAHSIQQRKARHATCRAWEQCTRLQARQANLRKRGVLTAAIDPPPRALWDAWSHALAKDSSSDLAAASAAVAARAWACCLKEWSSMGSPARALAVAALTPRMNLACRFLDLDAAVIFWMSSVAGRAPAGAACAMPTASARRTATSAMGKRIGAPRALGRLAS